MELRSGDTCHKITLKHEFSIVLVFLLQNSTHVTTTPENLHLGYVALWAKAVRKTTKIQEFGTYLFFSNDFKAKFSQILAMF